MNKGQLNKIRMASQVLILLITETVRKDLNLPVSALM